MQTQKKPHANSEKTRDQVILRAEQKLRKKWGWFMNQRLPRRIKEDDLDSKTDELNSYKKTNKEILDQRHDEETVSKHKRNRLAYWGLPAVDTVLATIPMYPITQNLLDKAGIIEATASPTKPEKIILLTIAVVLGFILVLISRITHAKLVERQSIRDGEHDARNNWNQRETKDLLIHSLLFLSVFIVPLVYMINLGLNGDALYNITFGTISLLLQLLIWFGWPSQQEARTFYRTVSVERKMTRQVAKIENSLNRHSEEFQKRYRDDSFRDAYVTYIRFGEGYFTDEKRPMAPLACLILLGREYGDSGYSLQVKDKQGKAIVDIEALNVAEKEMAFMTYMLSCTPETRLSKQSAQSEGNGPPNELPDDDDPADAGVTSPTTQASDRIETEATMVQQGFSEKDYFGSSDLAPTSSTSTSPHDDAAQENEESEEPFNLEDLMDSAPKKPSSTSTPQPPQSINAPPRDIKR